MHPLYPSWIEIPVNDLERALRFYRAVFGLADTPIYDDPPYLIAVLRPSDKSSGAPGVSLVKSPRHVPCSGGPQVNFHLGDHAALAAAIEQVTAHDGTLAGEVMNTTEGERYVAVRDCEGNTLALSSYEPPDGVD